MSAAPGAVGRSCHHIHPWEGVVSSLDQGSGETSLVGVRGLHPYVAHVCGVHRVASCVSYSITSLCHPLLTGAGVHRLFPLGREGNPFSD